MSFQVLSYLNETRPSNVTRDVTLKLRIPGRSYRESSAAVVPDGQHRYVDDFKSRQDSKRRTNEKFLPEWRSGGLCQWPACLLMKFCHGDLERQEDEISLFFS